MAEKDIFYDILRSVDLYDFSWSWEERGIVIITSVIIVYNSFDWEGGEWYFVKETTAPVEHEHGINWNK